MSLLNRLERATGTSIQSLFGANGTSYSALTRENGHRRASDDPNGMYDLYRYLYYNDVAEREGEDGKNLILGLRNPTAAIVNFHGVTTWPGQLPKAIPIETDLTGPRAENLVKAIHRTWKWSQWSRRKQYYARLVPMLGDGLIKVATRSNANGEVQRVYKRIIEPDYLTDFDVDERDFFTYLRLDVPRSRRLSDGKTEQYTHTEVWDKETGRYRVWEHTQGIVDDLAQLGVPTRDEDMESFGIDFIPFVHSKFLDLGQPRGLAAITLVLLKAHEANRMASRAHQLMYQYGAPDMQLVGAFKDADGLPMPSPKFDTNSAGVTEIADRNFYRLPSGWRIEDILPDVNFSAHIEALSEHMKHIQQTDAPQLVWYQIADAPELSGKALNLMLLPAKAVAEEVRGNMEADDIRANEMAIHIGQENDLFKDIGDLGAFEKDDFEHRYAERSIIPLSEEEEAAIAEQKSRAALNRQMYGWSDDALLKDDGLTDEDISEMKAERATSEAERGARLLRQRDAGGVDRSL